MRYFKLPPRCKWDLRTSVILCSVDCYLFTEDLGLLGPRRWEYICCFETSITNYQSALPKVLVERRYQWKSYCVKYSILFCITHVSLCREKFFWLRVHVGSVNKSQSGVCKRDFNFRFYLWSISIIFTSFTGKKPGIRNLPCWVSIICLPEEVNNLWVDKQAYSVFLTPCTYYDVSKYDDSYELKSDWLIKCFPSLPLPPLTCRTTYLNGLQCCGADIFSEGLCTEGCLGLELR